MVILGNEGDENVVPIGKILANDVVSNRNIKNISFYNSLYIIG